MLVNGGEYSGVRGCQVGSNLALARLSLKSGAVSQPIHSSFFRTSAQKLPRQNSFYDNSFFPL